MHTFRKLPIMQPNVKKTSDQKWNGTTAQLCVSKIASMPINVLFQRAAHHVERRRLSRPDFERPRALMQQHAETVRRATTGGFGCEDQLRFCRTINHVVNCTGQLQGKLAFIQWQSVLCVQAERRGVD